ncbi:myb/SANT-like DNA-binding domain-containing protein 3 [Periplaneta americana]|uniref:myb/SANT-like DNA-binding domain-containing protein 3 n=1 Tax=Periplaneta americana TaxID=6978 RepID=UPI0037E93359
MSVMEGNRVRAPNFNKYEVEILIELIQKYKHIIENKKTDGVSLKEKDATWRKIANEFGHLPGITQRTYENLKTAYENLKTKARRDSANDRLEKYKTDGGIGGPSKLDEIGERILDIIKPSVPVKSTYDSDAAYGEPITSQGMNSTSSTTGTTAPTLRRMPSPIPVAVVEDIVNGEFCMPVIDEHDGGDNTTSEPITSTPLNRKHLSTETIKESGKRKVSARDSITNAAETQCQLLNKEYQMKKEEHKLLMEIRKEKLELVKIKKEVAREKFWKANNAN